MKKDIEIYAEKYAIKHNITVEEAMTHQAVKDYYEEIGDRISNKYGRDIEEVIKESKVIGGC